MKDAWVRRSVNQLRDRAGDLLARHRQVYLRHIIQEHRFLRLRGVGPQGLHHVALEQVFVQPDLDVKPRPPSLNGYGSLPTLFGQMPNIWSHLDTAHAHSPCLIITGPPGCGKTTLLKSLALRLASPKKFGAGYRPPARLYPIFLNLSRHLGVILSEPELLLAQALRLALFDDLASDTGLWLAEQVEHGRCLILLDGLDEIAGDQPRRQVAAWLEHQLAAGLGNRYVLATRSLENMPGSSIERLTLKIQPLSYTQITQCVRRWGEVNGLTGAETDDLLQQLEPPSTLFKLAQNPLHLTMLVALYPFRPTLPRQRIDLYEAYCQLVLTQPQPNLELGSYLDRSRRQQLLRRLAYELTVRERTTVALNEAWEMVGRDLNANDRVAARLSFLKFMQASPGLMYQFGEGRYGFAHLSLQQYLAATSIREEHRAEALHTRVTEPWWYETLRFYAIQAEAGSTLAACLAVDKPPLPLIRLALAGLAETAAVKPEVRLQIDSVLDQALEDEDQTRSRQAAELLLANRLREMHALNEHVFLSDSLVSNAEYQLFLDHQRSGGVYRQPDHWLSMRFPAGQGRQPVTGVRPSDALAFCEWLTEREGGYWRYRLPLAEVSAERTSLSPLNYWVVTNDGQVDLAYRLDSNRQDEDSSTRILSVLTRALQPDRDLSFTREILQVLGQKVALARKLGLARVFDLKCAFDFSRVPAADQTTARNLVLVRALSLGYERSQDLAASFDRNSTRDLARSRQLIKGLNLSRLLDIELDLTRAYALALDRQALEIFDVPLNIKATWSEIVRFLHWYLRVVTLVVASKLTLPFVTQRTEPCLIDVRSLNQIDAVARAEIQRLINAYVELYINFVVLEERIQGNLPAFEGIRLGRERS